MNLDGDEMNQNETEKAVKKEYQTGILKKGPLKSKSLTAKHKVAEAVQKVKSTKTAENLAQFVGKKRKTILNEDGSEKDQEISDNSNSEHKNKKVSLAEENLKSVSKGKRSEKRRRTVKKRKSSAFDLESNKAKSMKFIESKVEQANLNNPLFYEGKAESQHKSSTSSKKRKETGSNTKNNKYGTFAGIPVKVKTNSESSFDRHQYGGFASQEIREIDNISQKSKEFYPNDMRPKLNTAQELSCNPFNLSQKGDSEKKIAESLLEQPFKRQASAFMPYDRTNTAKLNYGFSSKDGFSQAGTAFASKSHNYNFVNYPNMQDKPSILGESNSNKLVQGSTFEEFASRAKFYKLKADFYSTEIEKLTSAHKSEDPKILQLKRENEFLRNQNVTLERSFVKFRTEIKQQEEQILTDFNNLRGDYETLLYKKTSAPIKESIGEIEKALGRIKTNLI